MNQRLKDENNRLREQLGLPRNEDDETISQDSSSDDQKDSGGAESRHDEELVTIVEEMK